MKNVDDMTIEEAVEELRTWLLDFAPKREVFSEKRFEDLCYKLEECFNDCKLYNFTAECYFIEYDVNEGTKDYQITTNLVSGDYFDGLVTHGCSDFEEALYCGEYTSNALLEIDKRCATFTLEELQQELTDEVLEKVFKGHHVVNFRYLLTNPRKDVIEWTLKHQEELGISRDYCDFVSQYQVNPDLKKYILENLR